VSPNSARAQALHGTELLHEGDLAGAALHLLRSLSIWPHNPVVQTTCGRALFEQGRLADALIHADAALALRRNQPSALILRSMILGSLGRPGEAIPDARKYVRLVPTDSHGCLVLASLIRDAGQFQEALGQLVSCMKNDPALRPPLELVCSIYRNTGKPPQAKDACERMPGR
jgi:tetratricopeptide (TPR) repeat protein